MQHKYANIEQVLTSNFILWKFWVSSRATTHVVFDYLCEHNSFFWTDGGAKARWEGSRLFAKTICTFHTNMETGNIPASSPLCSSKWLGVSGGNGPYSNIVTAIPQTIAVMHDLIVMPSSLLKTKQSQMPNTTCNTWLPSRSIWNGVVYCGSSGITSRCT